MVTSKPLSAIALVVHLPKASLEQLPLDILAKIVYFTDQLDVLSLAYTSKAMARACLPRLYHTVIVDSSYTPFNKEHQAGATYINLSFYLKKLLRSYSSSYPIRNFYVVALPDLFNAYDTGLVRELQSFFAKKTSLKELVWLLDGFFLVYLKWLNVQDLQRLQIKLHESKLYSGCEPSGSLKLNHDFAKLETLLLSPVSSRKKMADLLSIFLRNSSVRLRALSLSRYDGSIARVAPAAEELALVELGHDSACHSNLEKGLMATVFKTIHPLVVSGLTSLSLAHMLVCVDDARLLAASVDLTQIKVLRLSNISEYETDESFSYEHGFLGRLGPRLCNLQDLYLDFRETKRDTVGVFLACVGLLESLDLIVRMNEVKEANVNVHLMYSQYIVALNQHILLQKLVLEFIEEFHNCETVGNAPLPFIAGLTNFTKLRSLRLSSGSENHKQRLVKLLQKLPNLVYLDDYGNNAGGMPNLSLGMVHPNIFDEWFKVQHVALLYHQAQPNLAYVRIKKCIFEFEEEIANPRSGIDRWFDEHVLVAAGM